MISSCGFFPSGCVDCLTVEEKCCILHFSSTTFSQYPGFLLNFTKLLYLFSIFKTMWSKYPHLSLICIQNHGALVLFVICALFTHIQSASDCLSHKAGRFFFPVQPTSPCAFQQGSGTVLALCRLPMHSLVRAWHLRGTHSFECKQSLWVFLSQMWAKIASCSFSELSFGGVGGRT